MPTYHPADGILASFTLNINKIPTINNHDILKTKEST